MKFLNHVSLLLFANFSLGLSATHARENVKSEPGNNGNRERSSGDFTSVWNEGSSRFPWITLEEDVTRLKTLNREPVILSPKKRQAGQEPKFPMKVERQHGDSQIKNATRHTIISSKTESQAAQIETPSTAIEVKEKTLTVTKTELIRVSKDSNIQLSFITTTMFLSGSAPTVTVTPFALTITQSITITALCTSVSIGESKALSHSSLSDTSSITDPISDTAITTTPVQTVTSLSSHDTISVATDSGNTLLQAGTLVFTTAATEVVLGVGALTLAPVVSPTPSSVSTAQSASFQSVITTIPSYYSLATVLSASVFTIDDSSITIGIGAIPADSGTLPNTLAVTLTDLAPAISAQATSFEISTYSLTSNLVFDIGPQTSGL